MSKYTIEYQERWILPVDRWCLFEVVHMISQFIAHSLTLSVSFLFPFTLTFLFIASVLLESPDDFISIANTMCTFNVEVAGAPTVLPLVTVDPLLSWCRSSSVNSFSSALNVGVFVSLKLVQPPSDWNSALFFACCDYIRFCQTVHSSVLLKIRHVSELPNNERYAAQNEWNGTNHYRANEYTFFHSHHAAFFASIHPFPLFSCLLCCIRSKRGQIHLYFWHGNMHLCQKSYMVIIFIEKSEKIQ